MRKTLKILSSVFVKHYNDVYFLVDIDYTYVHEVILRLAWLRLFHYEVNIDKVSTIITTFLEKEINKNVEPRGSNNSKNPWKRNLSRENTTINRSSRRVTSLTLDACNLLSQCIHE